MADEKLGRRGNMVARNVVDGDGKSLGLHWWFWCPGCDELHAYTTPRWTRTGTDDAPTFAPSLLVTYGKASDKRCHLFLSGGKLRFLGDCTHSLAGKAVPLPEPPEWLTDEGKQRADPVRDALDEALVEQLASPDYCGCGVSVRQAMAMAREILALRSKLAEVEKDRDYYRATRLTATQDSDAWQRRAEAAEAKLAEVEAERDKQRAKYLAEAKRYDKEHSEAERLYGEARRAINRAKALEGALLWIYARTENLPMGFALSFDERIRKAWPTINEDRAALEGEQTPGEVS